ncbi:MAG TPA: rhodanese-like domain-containing protein [Ktedonobacterales bacterium]|jgi:hydroxyacylglutathione hydrolase|nr:rhodanese-like domain-containing protein [Ktedonobacterales bacterium]
MRIEQFFLEGLGHQSYLVADETSGVAAVVDPRRDIEIYLAAAERSGVHITHVFETHVHNDYVTGALELHARVGATIVTAAAAGVTYDHLGVREDDSVTVGALRFVVLETPGHTPSHISFALYAPESSEPYAVFTGGSLLTGNAGRTDLVSPGMTLTLTRDQYHSLRRLLDNLPERALVYPTHGAGSFCGATNVSGNTRSSTIAQERQASPAAMARDEAEFVRQQLAGYGLYPAYYAYMRDINTYGPSILGGMPEIPGLTPQQTRDLLRAGIPLLDGRSRVDFAKEHIPGSINIELDASFAIYAGWLLPFNAPLSLLTDDVAGRREAVAQLIRIGFEQTQGYLDGGISAWRDAGYSTSAFERIDVAELHRRLTLPDGPAVLDVRDETEWRSGHIPGAQHIHVADLPRHLNETPMDRPVAVICRTGHRASIGASLIAALGRETIAVSEGVPDWMARGFPARLGAAESGATELEHAHP